MKKILLVVFGLLSWLPEIVSAQTQLEVVPGNLEMMLLDYEVDDVKHLVLTGTLNNDDLALLSKGNGILKAVETLDLSGVQCVEDTENPYNLVGRVRFFFSSEEREEIVIESSPDWVAHDSRYIYYYTRSFSGVFNENAPYKKIILPDYAYAGLSAFAGNTAVETVVYGQEQAKIGNGAFQGCSSLKSVNILPEGITIGDYAFYDCKNLAIPTFAPDSVGSEAFSYSSVTSADLSKTEYLGSFAFRKSKLAGRLDLSSLDSIPERAFYLCTGVNEIKFSPTLRYIGYEGLTGVQVHSMDLPATLEYLGAFALESPYIEELKRKGPTGGIYYVGNIAYQRDYDNLASSVVIREGTVALAGELFNQASGLKSVTLPQGLKHIGEKAFDGCDNLENVNFPEGLVGIHNYAFSGCGQLKTVDFPTTLRRIGERAFSYCTNILSLNLTNNITEIGELAFEKCEGVSKIYYDVDASSANFFKGEGLAKLTIGKHVTYLPGLDAPNLLKIDSEERADDVPFEMYGTGMPRVKSVVLPHTTKSLPPYAFYQCADLETLDFTKENIADNFVIGERALAETPSFTRFELPKGTTEIGDMAFQFSGLPSVELPEGLKKVGFSAFSGALNGQDLLVIPSSLTEYFHVYPYSSFDYIGVKSVYVPKEIAERGISLQGLSNLESLIFEEGATCIDAQTYESNFSKINIPEGVKAIKGELYSNNITELTIPDGVEEIGDFTFENMTKLSLPVSCVKIAAIRGKYQLNLFWRIPEDYKYEGDTSGNTIGMLLGPSGKLQVPEGVSQFGGDRDSGTTSGNFSEIILPSTLERIASRSFLFCTYPTITCYAETPPEIYGYYDYLYADRLSNVKLSGNLYVPEQSVEAYRNNGWDAFNIYPIPASGEGGVDGVDVNSYREIKEVYTLGGARIDKLPEASGVYIVRYDDGTVRKIVQ